MNANAMPPNMHNTYAAVLIGSRDFDMGYIRSCIANTVDLHCVN